MLKPWTEGDTTRYRATLSSPLTIQQRQGTKIQSLVGSTHLRTFSPRYGTPCKFMGHQPRSKVQSMDQHRKGTGDTREE